MEVDHFEKLMQNTLLYGTGVMLVTVTEEGLLDTKVVPIEDYTEVGDALKHIEQNRVDKK